MSKIYYSFLFCLATTFCFGQSERELDQLMESEAKSAMARMNFVANPNTQNYDVTYHELDLSVDPAVSYIEGVVTTTFTALENMDQVIFDFDDAMVVNWITQDGVEIAFSQNANDELIIELQNPITAGSSGEVVISYQGNPQSSGFGSFEASSHNGTPVMWTLSEPYGAKAWWPCKQDLNDKIDNVDIIITAPSQYTSVSNGIIVEEQIVGANKETHWQHNYRIPAYLIAFAVTNYEKYTHMAGSDFTPFPIDNYVYPESLNSAQSSTPVTVDIMDFFENTFEPYPFNDEKYGHAQFGWGGGMEHTTISFMGGFSRGLIAHELAHQWFGDKVTCGSWQDIWLNEGFATYLTGMTVEHLDGEQSFKNWRMANIANITSFPGGSVYVPASDTLSVNRVFSSRLSYNKGGMVMHMLRKKLGDENFLNGVQAYLSDPDLAYDYAKTPDLKLHLETASGMDLNEFFQDWVYGEGYPIYTVEWNQTDGNLNVDLLQAQSHPSVSFFEAPVEIRAIGSSGEEETFVLDHNVNNQFFILPVDFEVISVEFDPDYHLISANNSVILGTEAFELAENIILYPNPSSDKIKISSPDALKILKYSIYNSAGKAVLKNIVFPQEGTIDISSFSAGVYFLKLKSADGNLVKNFVIK